MLIVCVFDAEWQWEQLRLMKVGGNESATKYFQSNGGSAALASKDTKVKYTCNAATKYKDELKRRAAADGQQSVIPICFYPCDRLTVVFVDSPERLSSQMLPPTRLPTVPTHRLIQRMISSPRGTSLRSSAQVTLPPAQELPRS